MMFGNGYSRIGNCFGVGNGLMHGGWGMIIMLGLTALVVVGVILLIKKTGHHRQSDNAVLEALKMRLAKGEISEEEYLKRKTILD